jgi:hypothetical protein
MPLAAVAVPALIGAGATIYAGSQARKASGKALSAQEAAAAQQIQLQRENFDRIYGLNQPFVAGGQAAYDALLSRLHVGGGGAPTSPPATPAGAGRGAAFGGANGVDYAAPQGWSPQAGAADTFIDPRTPSRVVDARPAGGPAAPQAPAGPAGPEYSGAPYTTPGTPAGGGGFDAATYLQQNPDVAAEAKNHPDMTPEQFAAQHYQEFGQAEGRAQPMNPTTPATPGTVVTPDLMNATRPDGAPPPAYARPDAMTAPDIGAGPGVGDYFKDGWYQKSPGYDWALKQGLDSVNAASAARGRLRGGGTLQALQKEGIGFAQQDYGAAFQRQLQLLNADRAGYNDELRNKLNLYTFQQGRADENFNTDTNRDLNLWTFNTNRGDTNFNTDRGYQTGREDTYTGNLFDLTRIGAGAAGAVAGAGTNYANNAGNIYGSTANAQADAAYARAAANGQIVGAIGSAAGNIYGAFGGGGGAPFGGTSQGGNVSPKNVRIF